MEVILLERIEKLGQMGDVVNVKPGFARNYLLPKKKAVTASAANREHFETQRGQLEAQNLEQKSEAEGVGQNWTVYSSSWSAKPAMPDSFMAR